MPLLRLTPSLIRRGAATIATLGVTTATLGATLTPPLTPAAQAAALRGSAASYTLQYNADGTVARWEPCAPIHYRVNVAGATAGALADVQGAVARVAATTGMTFVYDGSTAVIPTSTYGQNVPISSTPPLVIAWASPGSGAGKSDVLTTRDAGKGGFATRYWAVGDSVHPWRIFTGYVVVNKTSNVLPTGFGTGRSRGGLLMHELGHVVGLGHTGDDEQLMYPLLDPIPSASWGAGDTEGLRRVGRSAGCVTGVEDFTGDGRSDAAVYRPSNGTWYIKGGTGGAYGTSTDVPVPADYTGDGRIDVAVWRPATGVWWTRGRTNVTWGKPGDVPVPGDYNGDGRSDRAVYRPSTGVWYIQGVGTYTYGTPTDVPVPADYTGDGRADVAVWRPATGVWWIRGGTNVTWGKPGDIAVPGDYNGDRRSEPAIWRRANGTGTWYAVGSSAITAGATGDVPTPGDYNGDGRIDPAVWTPSIGTWASPGMTPFAFGQTGDIPLALPAAIRMTQLKSR